jgi:chemotaxis methyl-accepting protein methylase
MPVRVESYDDIWSDSWRDDEKWFSFVDDITIHTTKLLSGAETISDYLRRSWMLFAEQSLVRSASRFVPGVPPAPPEKAYSLALVLGEAWQRISLKILATDVSRGSLPGRRRVVSVGDPLRMWYLISPDVFSREDGGFRVNESLRGACSSVFSTLRSIFLFGKSST